MIANIVIGFLVIALVVLIKVVLDKDELAQNSSRQLNEIRANYQKIEYKLTSAEQKINELNTANKNLQDELATLMENPLVNADKINKRIKK